MVVALALLMKNVVALETVGLDEVPSSREKEELAFFGPLSDGQPFELHQGFADVDQYSFLPEDEGGKGAALVLAEAVHGKRGPFLEEISVSGGKDGAEGSGVSREAFAEDQ